MAEQESKKKRTRVSQSDVPAFSLTEALKVSEAFDNEFGRQPAKPLHLAEALNMKPGSSRFRMLTGAAVAYGLTSGAYNSSEISLTELGKRCVSPTYDGEDMVAKREALLKPRIVSEFLGRYNGTKFPSEKIGENVLIDMGIAKDRVGKVLELIKSGAQLYGLTKEIKGELYVDLDQPAMHPPHEALGPIDMEEGEEPPAEDIIFDDLPPQRVVRENVIEKVFVTHGKNKQIADQLKELLAFGKFEPVLSVDHETVAKPVPQKVMDDMRSCGAAVIHVGSELKLLTPEGEEIRTLNQNVLIEIGAAMALYGQKFILLVERGVELPSNLQGLYEVRYEGDKLDYDATMKLLKAFNEFMA
jgi:hypothetical protein